ncbi:methyltransferase domain-containing protein [Embleya sp. NPDC005575]|uniref:methyltransferase domain-containing protein n=1 Tax=Embleya sp. NPDC005575 TaxID=3156892 RepID=UPI0033A08AA5
MRTWDAAAATSAAEVGAGSPWRDAVSRTPRHLLVPNWWEQDGFDWRLHRGVSDTTSWIDTAYADRTLVTQVGELHADMAGDDVGPPSDRPPTSSTTLPSLVLRMFDVAEIEEGMKVLDLGTGSGYSAALLGHRLGDDRVLSVDVDEYLVDVARRRLATFGRVPRMVAVDATQTLPDDGFDRAVAMFSTRTIPSTWLAAVRSGGVISTTLAGTSLHVRVTVTDATHAQGRVVSDEARFMRARTGPEDGSALHRVYLSARTAEGDEVRAFDGDVPNLRDDRRLALLLELLHPTIDHRWIDLDDRSMVWLLHPSGSWARAEVPKFGGRPAVHSSGPLDLWGHLDRARQLTSAHGPIDPLSLAIEIDPDGRRITWPAAGLSFPL